MSADCRARSSSAARSSAEQGASWNASIRPTSTPCASIGAACGVRRPIAATCETPSTVTSAACTPGIESASDATSWPRRSGC